MHSSDCREIHALLPLFAGGDLPPREAARVRSHLAECSASLAELETLQGARQALQTLAEGRSGSSVDLWPGIRAGLAESGLLQPGPAASGWGGSASGVSGPGTPGTGPAAAGRRAPWSLVRGSVTGALALAAAGLLLWVQLSSTGSGDLPTPAPSLEPVFDSSVATAASGREKAASSERLPRAVGRPADAELVSDGARQARPGASLAPADASLAPAGASVAQRAGAEPEDGASGGLRRVLEGEPSLRDSLGRWRPVIVPARPVGADANALAGDVR